MRRAALALVLIAALPSRPVPAAPLPAAAPAQAKPEVENPIQKLVSERKFSDAILRVAELRKAAAKPLADAESEYWAARAEQSMKLVDAARERMQAIARAYPDEKRGRDSAIEASTVLLNSLGDGNATTPEAKATAVKAAKELEATAGRLTDPEAIARAWYISGNGWRKAGEDAASENAHRQAAAVVGATDYPGRATYLLATRALARLDVAGARKLMDDCVKKFPSSSQAEKCARATGRLDLIGTPAPPLKVETWISGPPQSIEDHAGKVVLVWFFATWCPHCKAAMPEIAELKEHFAGQPLSVIAVTRNARGQTTESAAQFAADPANHLSYPVAVDTSNGDTSFGYQGTGIPAAVLVDKKGIVRWADHPTYLSLELIGKLLAE